MKYGTREQRICDLKEALCYYRSELTSSKIELEDIRYWYKLCHYHDPTGKIKKDLKEAKYWVDLYEKKVKLNTKALQHLTKHK